MYHISCIMSTTGSKQTLKSEISSGFCFVYDADKIESWSPRGHLWWGTRGRHSGRGVQFPLAPRQKIHPQGWIFCFQLFKNLTWMRHTCM